ncbi:putative type-2 restriction enzyme HindVP [Crenothrix polyspora]|uniref:Putative type-2 restriction enzyme HindVP n=1 Tax=Crenothrix polyspora TaxID=360316 RepID=A0A1R4H8V2_9GAMM|nr:HindVP family restriction endonuclease [Crenothrix polyspora]SJM92639.1 putative type-2 restriction enzyme HindVP [Crenothrix polyspora]
MNSVQPGLFGLKKTNRDFTQRETWGKNQFNSSFPAALCCYLASKDIPANYLSISSGKFTPALISIQAIFGIKADDEDAYFAFEAQHTPYQKYVIGSLPRTDLVVQREGTGECLAGLEVKLTALPDNTTCDFDEGLYGSEIVVRPDTIVYLACSIAAGLSDKLNELLPDIKIKDWSDANLVLKKIDQIVRAIEIVSIALEQGQHAFLLQPIWKTIGKSPELAENCLDMFVWSNAGFSHFIAKIANSSKDSKSITRQTRTAIWLYKMLRDIKENTKFDHKKIIDNLSYNTKNDKAFASAGNVTNRYMTCPRLIKPVITKSQIKEIILGGGQNLLSPERRFDAILFNSPRLFE